MSEIYFVEELFEWEEGNKHEGIYYDTDLRYTLYFMMNYYDTVKDYHAYINCPGDVTIILYSAHGTDIKTLRKYKIHEFDPKRHKDDEYHILRMKLNIQEMKDDIKNNYSLS